MSALLQNRWLSLAIRVSLGAVFVYSSWPKVFDPPAFAHLLWNYDLLPSFLINPIAIVLPWLELLAGVALIAGYWRRGAALMIGMMLAAFILALSIDLVRDIPVECGCFSVTPTERTHAELLAAMRLDILRDLGMLAMAFQVLLSRDHPA